MTIHARFIAEPNPASWIVRKFCWSAISHIEFVLPGEGYLGARLRGGVEVRPFNYCKTSFEAFAHIPCDDETTARILQFARDQIGRPYDWLNILGITFHEDWFHKRAEICSRFFFVACRQAGLNLLNIQNTNRVTPGMLAESPLFLFDDNGSSKGDSP